MLVSLLCFPSLARTLFVIISRKQARQFIYSDVTYMCDVHMRELIALLLEEEGKRILVVPFKLAFWIRMAQDSNPPDSLLWTTRP